MPSGPAAISAPRETPRDRGDGGPHHTLGGLTAIHHDEGAGLRQRVVVARHLAEEGELLETDLRRAIGDAPETEFGGYPEKQGEVRTKKPGSAHAAEEQHGLRHKAAEPRPLIRQRRVRVPVAKDELPGIQVLEE